MGNWQVLQFTRGTTACKIIATYDTKEEAEADVTQRNADDAGVTSYYYGVFNPEED